MEDVVETLPPSYPPSDFGTSLPSGVERPSPDPPSFKDTFPALGFECMWCLGHHQARRLVQCRPQAVLSKCGRAKQVLRLLGITETSAVPALHGPWDTQLPCPLPSLPSPGQASLVSWTSDCGFFPYLYLGASAGSTPSQFAAVIHPLDRSWCGLCCLQQLSPLLDGCLH